MELRHLQYFLACARCGSLTTAAEELYTTQPHVSMVIRELEQELGTRLFTRRSNGVELTEAGERVYGYALRALRNAELFASISREQREHSLRIATNNSSNMAVMLTAFYNEFTGAGKNRELYLRFTECGIEKMISLLSAHEYDLGFLFVPDTKRSALGYLMDRHQLAFTPLLDTDLVLYVGKGHPLEGRASVTAEEVASLSFIQLEDDFFTIEDLLAGDPTFRKKRLEIRHVVRTNSDHMMIRMLNKTKLCNLSSYWLKDVYRQYDFRRIPIEGMENRIAFGYLSRKGEPLNADVSAFLEYLRHALELDTTTER